MSMLSHGLLIYRTDGELNSFDPVGFVKEDENNSRDIFKARLYLLESVPQNKRTLTLDEDLNFALA